MLRIEESTKKLVAAREGTLVSEALLERSDIQEMIARSWDSFIAELGFPSLSLIDSEVRPHESVANRIDLLAFDEDLGRPVIIELKRHRNKLQLLQALGYAAMVWTWGPQQFKDLLDDQADDDLINSIDNLEEGVSPGIILIAEEYDPEVILTADWLRRNHEVDIYCFSISLARFGDDLLVRFQLDYPLRELDEVYRARRRSSSAGRSLSDGRVQTWEDVKRWITYPWGTAFIDYCQRIKPGDPRRRRFTHMFVDDRSAYYVLFQKEVITIVSQNRASGDVDHWSEVLPHVDIGEWGSEETRSSGLRFSLTSREDVDAFLQAVRGDPVTWG